MKKGPIIIKLGGSVITDKRREFFAKVGMIERISREISKIKSRMILIHGAGSFGHPIAKKYDLHQGYKNKSQLKALSETKSRLIDLDQILIGLLRKHGVPVVPFMPSSFMLARRGRIIRADLRPLKTFLELGIVPLLCGDGVPDVEIGFSIISGDQTAIYLAERMKARLVIFGCDVDGVYSADPKKNPTATLIDVVTPSTFKNLLKIAGKPELPDVTGGMLGKIRESLRLAKKGIDVVIMNLTSPQDLVKLVDGRKVSCTRLASD